MQDNKAQIQLQFNWIFVLIVGATLLIFFFTLIGGQSKSNEQDIAVNLAQRVKTILSATEQQPGTIKIYDHIPPLEIDFVCDSKQDFYNYVIEGVDAVDTKYNLFFSPSILDSDIIYTWTEEWRVPYQVANFLYLTNNKERYIFYGGTELRDMTTLYEEFPANFSKHLWNSGEEDKDLNMDGYTYIFFMRQINDVDNPSDLSFANTDLNDRGKILVIDPHTGDPFSMGTIYFLHLNDVVSVRNTADLHSLLSTDTALTTTYLGKASLYGAIFSQNRGMYECAMDKAMHRLQILTLLQYYRAQEVSSLVSSNCAYLLSNPETSAAYYLSQINKTLGQQFSRTSIETLETYLNKLDKVNNQLATMGNCPAIY